MKSSPTAESDFLNGIMRRLRSAPQIVYDSETTGLDWRHDVIVGHVFTFSPHPQDSLYVPVRHTGGGNISPDNAKRFEKELAAVARERPYLKWVFHYGAFDMKFLAKIGVWIEGETQDTMINAYLLNELQPWFTLDYCCQIANVQLKKTAIHKYLIDKFNIPEAQHKNAMGWFHKLSGADPVAVDYATGDGTSTWQLNDEQQKALDLEDLRRVWKVECRLMPVLNRMMVRGIKIDEERLHEVKRICNDRYKKAMGALPGWFTNDKSPSQLKRLFEEAGVLAQVPRTPPSERFPDGQPSFNAGWLKTHPLGQKVVAARQYRHIDNSFLTPLIDRHLHKGRVHTNFNQTLGEDEFGTKTGRLSSNDPNLQQIHKRNEELGRLIRSVFIPDAGMEWGESDYSQIEPRLLAHYSNCKVLVDGFRASPSIDSHAAVAAAMSKRMGIEFDLKTAEGKLIRQKGKTINQTLISGGGVGRIAAQLGLSMREAKNLMNDYFGEMPEIRTLQRESTASFEQRRYIRSLLGRKARLEGSRYSYKAINRILQLGNADVQKQAIVEADDYLRSMGDTTHIINNCHDALSDQHPKKDKRHYHGLIRIMIEQGEKFNLIVPLEVDSDVGRNWSEATWGPETKKEKAA